MFKNDFFLGSKNIPKDKKENDEKIERDEHHELKKNHVIDENDDKLSTSQVEDQNEKYLVSSVMG